ncbi:MAG: hypothetical protein ACK4GG_13550, partial [Sphingomonas sp.]
MSWVRASEFAAQRGVCKKTAVRMAQLAGYSMEKRPVRGGWAWFIDAPGQIGSDGDAIRDMSAQGIDGARLERCISLALKLD